MPKISGKIELDLSKKVKVPKRFIIDDSKIIDKKEKK